MKRSGPELYAARGVGVVQGWGRAFPIQKLKRRKKDCLVTVQEKGVPRSYVVDLHEVVDPAWTGESFPEHKVSATKLQVNDAFVSRCDPKIPVVVLDSPLGLSAFALKQAKVAEVHVPHPDPAFASAYARAHPGETVYQFLRDGPVRQYNLGLDYCCTWGGNDMVQPRADLSLVFARGLLAEVLWCTFSTRGQRDEPGTKVEALADLHGVGLRRIYAHRYGGMETYLWVRV